MAAVIALALGVAGSPAADGAPGDDGQRAVLVMRVDGAIGPATTRYVDKSIARATEEGASALILELDTPGGLESSMRDIIRLMLASPVPVVVHVTPSGARAASAGTFILYASHVAAMAPATNLGAATPISMGGLPGQAPPDEEQEARLSPAESKAMNDALAFIRGLAELRGRDAAFAEAAVRDAATLSSTEALQRGVIEIVAEDRMDLLRLLHGRTVELPSGPRTLDVLGAIVVDVEQDWQTRLLHVLSNPNLAYLLLMLGFYGLLFELSSPGGVLPGVAGAIALLVALFALQVLPVSFAGMALLLLGIGLMVAEAFVPSFGAMGAGGVVAFVAGSVLLLDVEAPGFQISRTLIGFVALTSLLFFVVVIRLAVRTRRKKVTTGRDELIGGLAVADESFAERGAVRIHGERWNATSELPVHLGDRLVVTAVDNLVLRVRPLGGDEPAPAPPLKEAHT